MRRRSLLLGFFGTAAFLSSPFALARALRRPSGERRPLVTDPDGQKFEYVGGFIVAKRR